MQVFSAFILFCLKCTYFMLKTICKYWPHLLSSDNLRRFLLVPYFNALFPNKVMALLSIDYVLQKLIYSSIVKDAAKYRLVGPRGVLFCLTGALYFSASFTLY